METTDHVFLKKTFRFFGGVVLFSLFILLLACPISFSEEIPQRIDGKLIRVDGENRKLVLDFEHPATLEHSELEFSVAEEAGFKDFKKLTDLKPGDLISLDYLDYGFLKAIYVIRIPPEKIYFTHQEIAGALLKIKNGQKESDEN